MSMIQSIIASAVGEPAPTDYPRPGLNYPSNTGNPGDMSANNRTIVGYYEAGSLNTISPGLYRRTYTGLALDGEGGMDTGFPISWNQVETKIDNFVGFGNNPDVAENFTMEWLGYFLPSVSGDFVFNTAVDDYGYLWIGQEAVTGFTTSNAICQNDSISWTNTMTAGKYYPVRIRFTEIAGNNQYALSFGLNNTNLVNNLQSTVGRFYRDINTNAGAFPGSGLIT